MGARGADGEALLSSFETLLRSAMGAGGKESVVTLLRVAFCSDVWSPSRRHADKVQLSGPPKRFTGGAVGGAVPSLHPGGGEVYIAAN